MMKMTAALAGIMLLAACGDNETPSANETAATTENAAAINYQSAVLELSDQQRNLVMIRAIRDAGIECQQVTGSERIQGESLTYRARCADGANHVVSIAADGNGQVVSAGAAAGR